MNDHTLPVTQRCLVSIQIGNYKDEIYCDVLPMDVAHVLLGRSWLYDLNVTNFGKDNIYSFKYKGKNIILRLAKPRGCTGKHDISKLPERNLHILKCKKFERDEIDALSRLIVTLHRMSAHVIRFDRLKDEYSACLDFGIIYDEVSYRNHHEYVDFLVENGYLFKVTKLCIPRTSFRDLLI